MVRTTSWSLSFLVVSTTNGLSSEGGGKKLSNWLVFGLYYAWRHRSEPCLARRLRIDLMLHVARIDVYRQRTRHQGFIALSAAQPPRAFVSALQQQQPRGGLQNAQYFAAH